MRLNIFIQLQISGIAFNIFVMTWDSLKCRFKKYRFLIAILLCITAIHLPLLFNDFHTDDFQVLDIMRHGFNSTGLKSMEIPANFRPLVNIVIYARYWLFDTIPGLWYLLNITLHLLAVILLFVFVRRQSDESTALLAALFFGIYFQHFEAVLWLYGIVRLLAAICVLAALINYQKVLTAPKAKNIVASYIFFGMGLLCVEDVFFLTIYLVACCLLFAPKSYRRFFRLYGAGFIALGGLYVIARILLLDYPGLSTAYFYPGPHIIKNIFAYFSWIVIPSLDHPYIYPFIKIYIGNAAILPAMLDNLAFVFLIITATIVIRRGNNFQRQMLLFVFVSLIPALFINDKVSTKLVYIPSIGVAVLTASLLRKYAFKPNQTLNKLAAAVVVLFLVFHSIAIASTAIYYGKTQKTVNTLLDELDSLKINWDHFDYLLFDNVPGRARLGKAFKYRFKTSCRLIDKFNLSDNQPDLNAQRKRLGDTDTTYIQVDFASGHPIVIDSLSFNK